MLGAIVLYHRKMRSVDPPIFQVDPHGQPSLLKMRAISLPPEHFYPL